MNRLRHFFRSFAAAALPAVAMAAAGAAAAAVLAWLAWLPSDADAAAAPATAAAPAGIELAKKVNELFAARCGECHSLGAPEEESPHFVGNLGALKDEDYLETATPEDSRLYALLLSGKMPRTSKSEKKAGRKAVPFSPDEATLVLEWIKAGAPAGAAPPPAIAAAEGAQAGPAAATTSPTPKPPAAIPSSSPSKTERKIVTDAELFAGALKDLLARPAEERPDTRYLSLAALHNNLDEISDADLKVAGDGVTKLLNSLSTNPKVLTFPPTGPEGVLRRIRLGELGWRGEWWDRIAATYPYGLNPATLSSLAGPAKSAVPLVRAEWFAAVASRPPFYDLLMSIPKSAVELERRLGIDVNANLAAGEAVRSGFTQSGISKQNRMVERHEIRSHAGGYWKSYDFRENAGRGRLHDFPLGPKSANLFRNAHAFEHAGGEIIFNLPNGFQAYMLADENDVRLDTAAPIEIVSDRLDKTRRAAISNGLSCIACHDEGMKTLPPDEVRATAQSARFSPEAARLIGRLYPGQKTIEAAVNADKDLFLAALKKAGLPPKSPKEPVIALVDLFERDVTLAQAAAELGLSRSDLDAQLEAGGGGLFDDKIALRGAGIPRVAFAEPFARMAIRLGLGDPRPAAAELPKEFLAVTDPHDLQRHAEVAPIAVELKTDKTAYRRGDLMRVSVQTSEDAYVRLLYQDAKGNVTVLLPNKANEGRIRAGVPVIFGEEASGFRLRVGPPYGQETLAAVVSNTPFVDEAEIRKLALRSSSGLAAGQSRARTRGVEVEIIETVRNRQSDGRLGVARVKVATSE